MCEVVFLHANLTISARILDCPVLAQVAALNLIVAAALVVGSATLCGVRHADVGGKARQRRRS